MKHDKTMSILMMYTNILAYIISSILHLASTGLTSRISRDRLLFPYNEHHNIINTQHMRRFNLPFSYNLYKENKAAEVVIYSYIQYSYYTFCITLVNY